MHILLAANHEDRVTGYRTYLALKRLGHRITHIFPVESNCADWVKVPREIFLPEFVRTLDHKPDLYLQVEWGARYNWFPAGIVELDIPTAFWSLDNHLNFRWQKEYCGQFDYAFFTQYGWTEKARRYGLDHVTWLPYAADEEFHRDRQTVRDIDVGYVGTLTKQKAPFFEKLLTSGIDLRTDDRHFTHPEAGQFYSRCKIVYNFSARFDLNHRTFEACMGGALMIGQKVIDKGFYEIFTPGVNVEVHDFDDAPEIIKRYLADPEQREKVARAGQEVVRAGHTYRHRMGQLLKICSGGVTARRRKFARSWQRHINMALVYQHPHFKLKEEARKEFAGAWKKNPIGTIFYLLKYGWWRVKEKIEKTIWEMGKRPV